LRRQYSSVSQIIHTMASEEPAKRKCSGADCDNDAGTLQCPTCLKLGTKDSYFCSQDCFKRNWVRFYSVSAAGSLSMALKN
jgi:zf-MYND-like zinc finger, mRNA-binding